MADDTPTPQSVPPSVSRANSDSDVMDSLMANVPSDLQIRGPFAGCWHGDKLDEARTRRIADNLLYSLCKAREMVGSWEDRQARSASADGVAAPEGWVLVPCEPTEAMLSAGDAAHFQKRNDMTCVSPTEEPEAGGGPFGYAYRAMLAASPTPPPPPPSDDLRAENERLREVVLLVANSADLFGPGRHGRVSDATIRAAATIIKDTPR